MDLKNKLEDWKNHFEDVTLTDILTWYRKLLKRLPDISHLKNVVLFGALGTLVIFILFIQRFSYLYEYLPKEPVFGGTYEEGVVGKIEQLNPLFSPLSSAESAATSLIFSGLTKENGLRKNVPDLAERWEVDTAGTKYKFYLKNNLYWHDGQKLTGADVAFTIQTIQDPDAKSPYFKTWEGVEVEVAGEREVLFKLKSPYSAFISETDVPIIPKHLLEKVPGRNLRISEFSKKPIGSGPYEFVELKEGEETQIVVFKASENYHSQKPFIENFYLKSYPTQQRLAEAYAKKEVIGMERLDNQETRKLSGIKNYQISIPTYDVLYFNLRQGFGKDKKFRDALAYTIDRKKIIKEAYSENATEASGLFLPGQPGHDSKLRKKVDVAIAKKKLSEAGYVYDKDGLKKDGQRVSLRLLSVDYGPRAKEARIIKEALGQIGIEVKEERRNMSDLVHNYIRPRDFDLLLVTQALGPDPDPYPYWHSTQVNDPGLNFSGYSNRMLDKFLEQARETASDKTRAERYREVAKIIYEETPALFLVSPGYTYGVSKNVKGVEGMRLSDPKNRFWNVTNWYIRDKREK